MDSNELTPFEMLAILAANQKQLTEWECSFVLDMQARQSFTKKQVDKLHLIWLKRENRPESVQPTSFGHYLEYYDSHAGLDSASQKKIQAELDALLEKARARNARKE